MGRQERDLAPGPLRDFASDLRMLRSASGMTYREVARRAGYSASALSTAASGQALPTLDVLLAYAGACGGNTEAWQCRWEELAAAGREEVPDGDTRSRDEPSGDQPVRQAPVAVAAKTATAAPPERDKRQRKLVQPFRFSLAPLILATAAIATYAVLRAAAPDARVVTKPPVTAPVPHPSGRAVLPSPVPPTTGASGAQPPVTASASHPSGPATLPSSARPAASAATAQPPAGGQAGQQPQVAGSRVRFDFEQTSEQWFVFWGQQGATGGISAKMAHRGTHSYLVAITGSSAARTAAIGVDEDNNRLAGLSTGTAVTACLRSSTPGDTTVRFFAMDPSSQVFWAPQNTSASTPLSPPGPDGWSTMTWTVPAVSHVHAIGVQFYSRTGASLAVAIDDVSW